MKVFTTLIYYRGAEADGAGAGAAGGTATTGAVFPAWR